jgi:hypothetical protein
MSRYAPLIVAATFALFVLVKPVFAFLAAALEAWGYASMNGLSQSLSRRLFGYALACMAVGAVPVVITWSIL